MKNCEKKKSRPIVTRFYTELSWADGSKVCSNGPGHMTNMGACLFMVKPFKNSSSLEPADRLA